MSDPVVVTMNVEQAEAYVPESSGEVCISIFDPGKHAPKLSDAFLDVLQLAFGDFGCVEDRIAVCDGAPEGWTISVAQAGAIAEFVARHRNAPKIIVHCGAGISRSHAVATAIGMELLCRVITREGRLLNRHVYSVVRRALRGVGDLA